VVAVWWLAGGAWWGGAGAAGRGGAGLGLGHGAGDGRPDTAVARGGRGDGRPDTARDGAARRVRRAWRARPWGGGGRAKGPGAASGRRGEQAGGRLSGGRRAGVGRGEHSRRRAEKRNKRA
jgi:hypothetical protein